MPRSTFPIQTRRAERMKRVQKVQHLFGAFLLITAAWDHLQHGPVHLLPLLEMGAGALLIASVVAERLRRHAGEGVAWVEIAGAGMVLVEALAKLEQRHHLLLYVLYFVQPLVLLAFALFDLQINALRRLATDDDGFTMRTRLMFARHIAWAGVRHWRTTPDALEVTLANGRARRLSFRDVLNRQEALEWTAGEFARRFGSAAEEPPRREGDAEQREGDQQLVPLENRGE